jgi:hypothetical protein
MDRPERRTCFVAKVSGVSGSIYCAGYWDRSFVFDGELSEAPSDHLVRRFAVIFNS